MAKKPLDPRYAPQFQRGYESSGDPVTQRPASQPDAPAPVPQASSVVQPIAQEQDVAHRRRVNPYLVALWIIGVLLVIGGVTLYVFSSISSYSGYGTSGPPDTAELVVQSLGYTLAVPMVTVGLGVLAGLVFFSAVRWRGTREKVQR